MKRYLLRLACLSLSKPALIARNLVKKTFVDRDLGKKTALGLMCGVWV